MSASNARRRRSEPDEDSPHGVARQIAADAPTAEGRHVAVLNSEGVEVGKVLIAAVGRETA
jgi:hypothetical protein